MNDAYHELLHAKAAIAPATGFEIEPGEISDVLKPHQQDAVRWAVRGGRRALFESFGLGKTLQQLEILRLILEQTAGRGLIVCPLGVRQEFTRDARLLGVEPRFIRRTAEASTGGIYLTNYESVREGKVDASAFDVVSLDEAAILRGFGGTKTFREMMRLFEGTGTFRFVATATPSPNDLDPFAGIMTVPYCALKLGRQAIGIELNAGYWADGVEHVESIARKQAMPTLFDTLTETEVAA